MGSFHQRRTRDGVAQGGGLLRAAREGARVRCAERVQAARDAREEGKGQIEDVLERSACSGIRRGTRLENPLQSRSLTRVRSRVDTLSPSVYPPRASAIVALARRGVSQVRFRLNFWQRKNNPYVEIKHNYARYIL